jgi:anti-anti-sigma regulatory factor
VLVSPQYPTAEPANALLPVNLAMVDAAHLGRILQHQPASLLIDCGTLPYQRTLGICFLVSQLLLLRQSGATVHLRNVSPVLQRCLHKLHLSPFFLLAN